MKPLRDTGLAVCIETTVFSNVVVKFRLNNHPYTAPNFTCCKAKCNKYTEFYTETRANAFCYDGLVSW